MSTQNIAYSIEPAEEVFDELVEACGEWWYESTFYKNTGMEYAPDNPQFRKLLPLMRCLVGRDIEGSLVAAYMGIPSDYMFNTDWEVMNEIVWFLREDYRGPKNLLGLFREIEFFCKNESVDMWSISIPSFLRGSGVEKLMGRYGYFLQDLNYVRVSNE